MAKSTKLIITGVICLAAIFAGYQIFNILDMGGEPYFVKITTNGKKLNLKADSGEQFIDYQYELVGVTEDGKKRELIFNGNRERPLRKNAYLKVIYNSRKDEVTQWSEVSQGEVPSKALTKIE